MDTRQLAAFCAVVDRKSFSLAAEQLGVTQPAVSLQIRSLEKRLGERLLDRSGRRVEPTEAGQPLYPGATVLPLLLCEFQRENPDVAISLSVNDTLHVIDLVAERRLELGVVGAAPRHRGVTFEPFFQDQIVLAVPPGHRLADATVKLEDLRSEAVILMQEGAGVRQMVEDELRAGGIRLRDLDVKLELGLQESVKAAVAAGHGVTFISRSSIEPELAAGTLAAATVEGLAPTREISLVRSTGRTPSRVAEAFVAFARERIP